MMQRTPPPATAAAPIITTTTATGVVVSGAGRYGSSPQKVSRKISPPRHQPPHTPDELQFAKRTLQKLVQDSHFFPVLDKNNRVQTIRESELEFGSVIGKGGFCEVRSSTLKYAQSSSWGNRDAARHHHHHRAAPSTSSQQRYAMKYLSPTKTTSSRVFQRGIADLAMEACFLSLLRHDNIIGLHYVSEGSLEENYNCAANNNNNNNNASGGRGGQGGGQQDEIVMDAYGNLQLRRRPQQGGQQHNHHRPHHHQPPPAVYQNHHMFGYFLLLDPLHETLTDRIERTYVPQTLLHSYYNTTANNNEQPTTPHKLWDRIRHKNNNNNNNNNTTNATTHSNNNNRVIYDPNDPRSQLAQRVGILKCVASALKYLHDECHIIFRDIKPDNIGFYRRYHSHCSCGYQQQQQQQQQQQHNQRTATPNECTCYDEITKLFDFGLAKELKPKYRKSHPAYPDQDTYKLTGCTGSRRYMAPEVCFSDPYNTKADVYSFGMLLYQVSSLVTPFDGFGMGKHEREVLRGGFRPDVNIPPMPSTTNTTSNFLSKTKKSVSQSGLLLQQEQAMLEEMMGGSGTDRGGGGGTGGNNDVTNPNEKKNQLLALRTKRYWPKQLPTLMEECWDYDMRYRPEMKEVTFRLDKCIDELVVPGKNSSGGGGGAVAGHWPKFTPIHNTTKDEACAVTMDTTPTGHSYLSHGPGFVDTPNHHQQQQMFTLPGGGGGQLHHQQQQHFQFGQNYSEEMAFGTSSGSDNNKKKTKGREKSFYSAVTDKAVYQGQRRRSNDRSNDNSGDEPMMMNWR